MPKSRIDIIGQNGNDGLHYVEACQHPCLIPIRSQQIRICADCKAELPWPLGERKPVGWGVDRELQKITHRTE